MASCRGRFVLHAEDASRQRGQERLESGELRHGDSEATQTFEDYPYH